MSKEIRGLNHDIVEKSGQVQVLNQQLEQFQLIKINLEREKAEKKILEEKTESAKQTLDIKLTLFEKERSIFQSFLQKLSKLFPSVMVIKNVNQWMKILEEIINNDRERLKLEYKIKKSGDSLTPRRGEGEKGEMTHSVSQFFEKSSKNYDHPEESKKELDEIENNIENLMMEERKKGDRIYEYEIKIRQLESQLNDTLNRINLMKVNNSQSGFDKTTTRLVRNDSNTINYEANQMRVNSRNRFDEIRREHSNNK